VRATIAVSCAAGCLALLACSSSSGSPSEIPRAERAALLELFDATSGTTWTRRDWWQTPGRECSWHGVVCGGLIDGHRYVVGLELSHNNLRGTIPNSATRLQHLTDLWVFGNALSGPLPDGLLARFDRGELRMSGYAEQLSRIRELSLRSHYTEFVCNERELRVRGDAFTRLSRERCNAENSLGRPWWQYRGGQTGWAVDRLFRLVEVGGFERLRPEYPDDQKHTHLVTISVEYRNGSKRAVQESGGSAPMAFWLLKNAIESVVLGSLPEEEVWSAGPSAPDFDAVPPERQWAGASSRADPSDFRNLPASIRAYLERRRCRIPQSSSASFPNNVVRGRFTAADQTDTAVLCSIGGVSTILIFRGDEVSDVAEIAPRPDDAFILGASGSQAAYWRTLAVASRSFILDRHTAHGGPTPPALDHDGIDDIDNRATGKTSIVWYAFRGRWLKLQGIE
jgi:hypothetical protein